MSIVVHGKNKEDDYIVDNEKLDKIEVEECICVDCDIFGCNENCQTCKVTGKAMENFRSERMRND